MLTMFVIVQDENGKVELQIRESNYELMAGQVEIPFTYEYPCLKYLDRAVYESLREFCIYNSQISVHIDRM